MLIISINSILRRKKNTLRKEEKWIYIGKSFKKLNRIETILNKNRRFYFTELFQSILLKSKYEFIDYVNDLTSADRDISWWSNKVSYLSPLVSDFYENYCHIKLIKTLSEQESLNLIVVIEDDFLFSQLCDVSFEGTKIFNDSLNLLKIKRFKYYLYNHIKLFYSFLRSVIYFIAISYYRIRKSNKYKKSSIIKLSWIEDRCFRENKFNDVYFKGIEKIESEIGKSVTTITLPFIPLRLVKKSLKDEEIFPLTIFLSFRIIFKALFKALFFNPKLKKDKNHLFNREIANKKAMFESLIFFFIMKKFINKFKEVKTIILPFENQPNDKLLILANMQSDKEVNVVGYQHASVNYMYLNYCVSEKFKEETPLPDIIVATSKYSEAFFNSNNYTSKIINGGSLKYNNYNRNLSPINGDTFLILLSYDLNQSLNFLNFIINSNLKDKQCIIKPHPNFPEHLFRKNIDIPDNFKFIDCSMDEFFSLGKIVIHNGTTAAVECMSAGLQVYKYIGERIDLDPLLNTTVNQGLLWQGSEVLIDTTIEHENLDEILNDINLSNWETILS
jgi:hypothetical protein